MASLHCLTAEPYGESANDAAIQAATTIAMKVVIKGDQIRVLSAQSLRFHLGPTVGAWKARIEITETDASTLIVRANFDTNALLFNVTTPKTNFDNGVYYTFYAAVGPASGGRVSVSRADNGTLVAGTTNGTTRTLAGTGTDYGKVWLIRNGPFSINPPLIYLAGFAVQDSVPADEWSEPDAGACLSKIHFDNTSGTVATAAAGPNCTLKNNTTTAVEATDFEWVPAEGPWNGGGAPPAPDAFVKVLFRGIAS